MTKAKIDSTQIRLEENAREIAFQRSELETAKDDINFLENKILGLQNSLIEKETNKSTFDESITSAFESVLTILQKNKITPVVDLEQLVNDKEKGIEFIQQQINVLAEQDKKYRTTFKYDMNRVLQTLLPKIEQLLNTTPGFSKKEIGKLVDASGLIEKGKSARKGFDLLLVILGETDDNYGVFKSDAKQKVSLLNAISIKSDWVKVQLEQVTPFLDEVQSSSSALQEIERVLIATYDSKTQVEADIAQIPEQISDYTAGINILEKGPITKIYIELDSLRAKREIISQELEVLQTQNAQEEAEVHAVEGKTQRALLANKLIGLLEVYKDTRQSKFKAKDVFSSTDKEQRFAFIKTIENQLMDYVASGDNSTLISTINAVTSDDKKFTGNMFKPTLNKILVELIDVDAHNTNAFTLREKANEILATQKANHDHHHTYIKQILNLYSKVHAMTVYSTTLPSPKCNLISQLAEKLECDISNFILDNPGILPSKSEFRNFKTKFSARLNSENDVMSNHNKEWKPVLANISAGIFLLGDKGLKLKATDALFREESAVKPTRKDAVVNTEAPSI